MRTRHPLALAFLFVAVVTTACGTGDSPTAPSTVTTTPPPATTTTPAAPPATYAGVFAGARGADGSIEMTTSQGVAAQPTIRALASVSSSGTVTPAGSGGARVTLRGTFDTTSATFTLSGGGYSISARVEGAAVSGTCRTPAGVECGVTAAQVTSAVQTPTRYYGPFVGAPQGRIVFVVTGATAPGFVSEAGGHVNFTGAITGSSIQNTASLRDGHTGRADGTLSGSTWSGAWTNTYGERGTWSASPWGCQ